MYEVYLSPRPELSEDDAEIIEITANVLTDFSKAQHDAFGEYTSGCKPYVLLVGIYLRLDMTLDVLKNYRSMIVEMVEDFEALGDLAVQLAETIKACESILEQITFAAANVYTIDQEVFEKSKYGSSLVATAVKLLGHKDVEPDVVQLELQL